MLITISQLVNQSTLSTVGWFPLIRPKIKPLFLRGYIWGGRLTSQIDGHVENRSGNNVHSNFQEFSRPKIKHIPS